VTNRGYYGLRQKIYSLALPIVVEKAKIKPDVVITDIGIGGDVAPYQEIFSKLKGDKEYDKYRFVCLAFTAVDLQIRRVDTIITLLIHPTVPPISLSEWADYHFEYWFIAMYGLLDRVVKLIKRITRDLIRPNNPKWRIIENEMIDTIELAKEEIANIRHLIAHVGWAEDALDNENLLPLCIIAGDRIDYSKEWYSTDIYQEEWAIKTRNATNAVLEEIDKVADRLRAELP
jgi:hypothetical protein